MAHLFKAAEGLKEEQLNSVITGYINIYFIIYYTSSLYYPIRLLHRRAINSCYGAPGPYEI